MSIVARIGAVALLAGAAIGVAPAGSQASCTGSDRIDHGEASCLKASWRNKKWPARNSFDAQNLCSDYGRVVAKVDIEHHKDKTWYLDNGNKKSDSVLHEYDVRRIYCCDDLSDLCDDDDKTGERCIELLNRSSAGSTCVEAKASISGTNCKFYVKCRMEDGHYRENKRTYTMSETRSLYNCGGSLSKTAC